MSARTLEVFLLGVGTAVLRLVRGAWSMVKQLREATNEYPPPLAMMRDGEISKCVNILPGVAQGCTLSSNIFKVYINDMIVAIEAAKQGVTMGEDTVSGLIFADGFVGLSETPEGLQEQVEKALGSGG